MMTPFVLYTHRTHPRLKIYLINKKLSFLSVLILKSKDREIQVCFARRKFLVFSLI